ncbi:MAG: alpha-galactosidase, partial [Prevotella sp.]|nr:alpha-galactosidase [Prevotella sp.]
MNKKRLTTLVVSCIAALGLQAENVNISTKTTSLVVDATKGNDLKFMYYGAKLSDKDIASHCETGGWKGQWNYYSAYPAYGVNCDQEYALSVVHANGDMALELRLEDVEKQGDVTIFKMKDKVQPFYVNVCYRTRPESEVIETWTEIFHQEKKPVRLTRFYSGSLPIRRGDVWVSHLYGSWANEGQLCEEPLNAGMIVIENKDGVRNSHTSHGEVMISLDGKARENSGDVIGAAICYTGNYKLSINTHDDEYHQLFAGINEEASEYYLAKGEVFKTPVLALTFSREGLSGASRNFHKWGRKYMLAHGDKVRDILLNSWEGVYFDINEQGMDQMMSDIASMGGELFVMDDGWFGDKYPRKTDNSSLGDWVVDRKKLPNGVPGLVKAATKHGIKFGIWIEPEMTNSVSELYEQHPDWVVKTPGRDLEMGRGGTQLVLDLSNPKVQDFAFSIVDNLMKENPELYYIKWDANMNIRNHGSQYLSMDRQSHLLIDYHKGFIKLCERIRAKYPDLIIQDCASGGGRANWGYMPYFDEFWVSDNTDALQRVYMQWGTSYFFPAITMASHISAAPNHQTFRTIPLKYRIDVAMSGRLGMEIQPKNMTDEEKTLCRKAIADYKTIRPIVQLGNIYRLQSPY